MRTFAFLCLAAFGLASTAEAADRVAPVRFPSGATAKTLKGVVGGEEGVVYEFAAAAGQTLQMLFKPSNRSCYFNVTAPGADAAEHVGSVSGNEFGKKLTASGDYRAQVYLMRNAARGDETCRYSLSIEITGAPGGVSAGVSDAILRDKCKAEAAPMYGVAAKSVSLTGVRPDAEGFRIDGFANKGAEGFKKLRCLFDAQRKFKTIMALTSDGE